MSDLYLYDPDICDGEEMEADRLEDDDRLEMGFDPYLGCYTDDC